MGGSGRVGDDLLKVAHALMLVEDLDDVGPAMIAEIGSLVASDLASYNEVDPTAGRASVVGRPRQPTAAELDKWRRWAHQNPCLQHTLRTGDGSAKRLSDFLEPEELHRLELYSDVYQPLGIEYQLSLCLPAPAPLVIAIALNRAESDFSDDEVQLLDTLRPQMVQAYRRLQLLSDKRRALERVAELLGDAGQAFHIIGEAVRGPAAQLMSRYFGQAGADLPSPVQHWLDGERWALSSSDPRRLRQPLVCHQEPTRGTEP